MTIKAVFFDIGGVLLSNGWDREQRAVVAAQFGLDATDFGERHKLAVPELELGRMTLDEYLEQTVFCHPQTFTQGEFRAAMQAQSTPHADALALARDLSYGFRLFRQQSGTSPDCRLHVRNQFLSHSHPLGLNVLCSPFNRSPYQPGTACTP